MPIRSGVFGLLIFLGGCASSPPISMNGDYLQVTPQQAQDRNLAGKQVLWGGEIMNVSPGHNESCFELVGYALDETGRPLRDHHDSQGRFIACMPGFCDSVWYATGRSLTVAGILNADTRDKARANAAHYPLVAVEQLYLWPERFGEGGHGHGH